MTKKPSFFQRALKSVFGAFLTRTKITKIEKIARHFVMIRIEGAKLKESKWVPGGKVQIDVGGMKFRTYTPIDVDRNAGALTILCYRREESPAAAWIDAAKVGDACEIFGPRDSLDFSALGGEVVLFGDETSFAISKVLQTKIGKSAHLFLEVTSQQESEQTLGQIGVHGAQAFQRLPDGTHLQKIAQGILELHAKQSSSMIFLTGRASSIQTLRSALKEGVPNNRLKAKAYWADGKAGLD